MADKLDHDLVKAAEAQASPLPVEQASTHKVYYIYTEQMHQQASHALREQQTNDAIAEGLQQMERGEGRPLHEVDAAMQKDFSLPPRQ